MKTKTHTDAASNVALNPVTLPDGSVVAWCVAFPSNPTPCERRTPRED